MPKSYTNPQLQVVENNMPFWNSPANRRQGFRNLHRFNRYGITLRSDQVLQLEKNIDYRVGEIAEVRNLTSSEIFCGMTVARGQEILFEKYASDFTPQQPHTIMSISKTTVNLIVGELVRDDKLDLDKTVSEFLPDIGSGYAQATLQQVMDMDVSNEYSEDYCDPGSMSFTHETSLGWRLQGADLTLGHHDFLRTIKSNDVINHSGLVDYKSANTEIMAWIAESVSGLSLRDWLIRITEAAGFEQALYAGTDRTGIPFLDGVCASACET